ncbi:hypothetical protein EVAR_60801_1 [Eumeta japonica]|uniref:Uncharacterized protein n=1 Tax=Eumeta variegata TaxID=151549 RepID=A0A4C1YMW4_EUMVA|nr:hypothetical protein EVAR_60801_1 [Eumeta japonica]
MDSANPSTVEGTKLCRSELAVSGILRRDEVLETRRTGGRVPSESCKRRLLCELNKSIQQRRKQKQRPKEENCMKHLCSDSSNLQELMQLINSRDSPLTHNTNGDIITR